MDTIVYKVVDRTAWEAAVGAGSYGGSLDDVRDGFIHLSARHQLEGTLARHYRNKRDLMLVAFDAGRLGEALRWEVSRGNDLFPHLYGPLPSAAALWARPLEEGPDGSPVAPGDLYS